MLLEVTDITVHYFKVPAVRNISINVGEGRIVTLIGSNGAGKTTTLRAISGLKHPSTGEIHFNGQRIDKLPPYKINALGIAMVPEGRRLFLCPGRRDETDKGLTVFRVLSILVGALGPFAMV